jgi:hypothetical protein
MKKHICILFCFQNIDHIEQCFNCLKTGFTDFFIIENQSVNSPAIKDFFMAEGDWIIGYYQFKENITNNALSIFLEQNKKLLQQYEYITISDCDLYVEDARATFEEIFKNLYFKDVIFSCVDLSEKNRPPKNIWRTSNKRPIAVNEHYIQANTGAWLMSILNQNIDWLYGFKYFIDSKLHRRVQDRGKKWVKTLNNKADHLTWELCTEGSAYIDFKNEMGRKAMWRHDRRCDYLKLIGE